MTEKECWFELHDTYLEKGCNKQNLIKRSISIKLSTSGANLICAILNHFLKDSGLFYSFDYKERKKEEELCLPE